MKFKLFYLFYLLVALLLGSAFIIGFWPFFIVVAIISLLTGIIYHLFYRAGRQILKALIIVHFVLVILGLLLSVNLFRVLSTLANAGAPDTVALSGGIALLFAPLILLAALVIFIVALSTSKKIQPMADEDLE